MLQAPEQLVKAVEANRAVAQRVADIALGSAKRFADLQVQTAKSALADSAKNAEKLAAVKDVQQLASLGNELAQPAAEKAAAYVKSVFQLVVEASAELRKVAEQRTAELNKEFVAALEQSVKSGPVGSEVAVNAVKSAIASANSAYDNFSKVAKRVVEITEANVAAVTTQATVAAKKKAA